MSTCAEPRSYTVEMPNGSILRRNRKHILDIPPTQAANKQVRFSPENEMEDNLTPGEALDVRQPAVVNNSDHTDDYHTRSGRTVRKKVMMDL